MSTSTAKNGFDIVEPVETIDLRALVGNAAFWWIGLFK